MPRYIVRMYLQRERERERGGGGEELDSSSVQVFYGLHNNKYFTLFMQNRQKCKYEITIFDNTRGDS